MPRVSHSGPSTKIETVNPQVPAPAINPTSLLFSPKWDFRAPMIPPMTANETAVAISAMQLARKSRSAFTPLAVADVVRDCSTVAEDIECSRQMSGTTIRPEKRTAESDHDRAGADCVVNEGLRSDRVRHPVR